MTERVDTWTLTDLRWLLGLLTIVATIMYGVEISTDPNMRHPLTLAVFTLLVAVHLLLHWLLIRISPHPFWLNTYVIIQGCLFFAIALISGSLNMIFPLFSGLLGEAIGTFGLNRRGILAASYITLLLIVSFFLIFDWSVSMWMFVGTLAIVATSVFYTVLYKRQAEARQQAQSLLRDLEIANTKLRDYADQVEELSTAAERQRMARELHDTLSQGLAGLALQLEAVEAHLLGSRPDRGLEIVQQAKIKARETLSESRAAIEDLRQSSRSDLRELLCQEVEHFTSSTGTPCDVAISLPTVISEQLFETIERIVAEGLTNIARHARAKKARLQVDFNNQGNQLSIEIGDDGIGFEPLAVEDGHYGLLGIRERALLVGGSYDVISSPGKGTQLIIRLPIEDNSHV